MAPSPQRRLQAHRAHLQRLAAELASTGFISQGTVVQRYMPCGKAGCRCKADPPQLHGPYWQWTRAMGGKTFTRRLTESQARLYQEWISNRRRLAKTLAEMEKVSEQAAEILLHSTDPPSLGPDDLASTPSPPRLRMTRQLAESLAQIPEMVEPLAEAAQHWLEARDDDDRQAIAEARHELVLAIASPELAQALAHLARLTASLPVPT